MTPPNLCNQRPQHERVGMDTTKIHKMEEAATFEDWFLGCKPGHQLWLLVQAQRQGRIGELLAMSRALLDTPISEGGLSSTVIQSTLENEGHQIIDEWQIKIKSLRYG